MRMTRDEALKVWLPVIQMGVETMPECKEALDIVVETMRKYQQIEQIVENVDKRHYGYSTMMDYLHEVIDNGNDD